MSNTELISNFWTFVSKRLDAEAPLADWRLMVGPNIDFTKLQRQYLVSTGKTANLISCPKPCSPAWRELDGACRSLRGKIADLQDKLDSARAARREQPRHIQFEQLPPEHQFQRLATTRKLLLDTVRMIAYRAETALVAIARPALTRPEEARAMIGALFNTSADLHPDPINKKLLVVLHPLAETRQNRMAEHILAVLNEAEFVYPGTELQMVYRMRMPSPPPST